MRAAREVVSEAVKTGSKNLPDCILITNHDGEEVAVVALTAVLPSLHGK